jgi:hypothetical protein
MLVYLISTYGEYGSEGMKGTSSTDDLPRLIRVIVESKNRDWNRPALLIERDIEIHKALRERHISEILENLPQALLAAKASPGEPQDLTKGWGGLQLHVIDVH